MFIFYSQTNISLEHCNTWMLYLQQNNAFCCWIIPFTEICLWKLFSLQNAPNHFKGYAHIRPHNVIFFFVVLWCHKNMINWSVIVYCSKQLIKHILTWEEIFQASTKLCCLTDINFWFWDEMITDNFFN